MFEVIFSNHFDIGTGDSRLILVAVGGLMLSISKKLGAPAAGAVLAEKILPSIGISPQNAVEVAKQLTSLEELPLRKYLKGLVVEMRQAQGKR